MRQERDGNAADSDSLSELEQIKGYLGSFMERLSALSEEYETEKASLERAMFATLSDKSVAATQAIVDADFNKRMLVNIVQEYEQSAQSIVTEGIEARRNAEKRFATKLLATTSSEFQNVVTSMREEDRKKLEYMRDENKHRLDNCRTAMNVESSAKLLRQQADTEVQHKKVLKKMEDDFQVLTKGLEQRVHAAEMTKKSMQDQLEKAEAAHRILSGRLQSEIDTLKDDVKLANDENNYLMKEMSENSKNYEMMKEELEEVRRDFATMEARKTQEVKDLRQQINKDADQARKREAKLLERVEERKKEMQAAQAAMMSAQAEAKSMSAERNKLKGEVQELQETLEHEREFWETELSEKVTEIEELQAKCDAANAKLAELALKTAELEDTCRRLRKELQDETARCKNALEQLSKSQQNIANVQADVSTWAMDAHASKSGHPADLDYQGTAYSNGEPAQDVSSAVADADHLDLMLLLQIVGGQFAGLYAISDDRPRVAEYLDSCGKSSPLKAAVERSESTGSMQKEKSNPSMFSRRESMSTAPMLQQLSEANSRIQTLEEELETLRNESSERLAFVQAEWRAKCISLAQRLEKTEAEIPNPRPQDVEEIKQLESQVRALMSALNGAAKEKLLQDPNWKPPAPSPERKERPVSHHSKQALLAHSHEISGAPRPVSRQSGTRTGGSPPRSRSSSRLSGTEATKGSRDLSSRSRESRAPARARTPTTSTGDSLSRMPSRPR